MKIRVFNMKWPKGLPHWTTPQRKEQTYVELPDSLNVADKGDAEYHDEMIHGHILEALKVQFGGSVPLDFDWDEDIKEPSSKTTDNEVQYSSKWHKQLQRKERADDWEVGW